VLDGQLYLVDFNDNNVELDTCLIAKTDMGWLWHHRLAHVGMKNLHKLIKGEHILGLTNVHFEKDRICSACQAGKPLEINLEGQSCLLSSGAPDKTVRHRSTTVHVRCAISFHIGRSRPLLLGAGWRTGHNPVPTG
jgi:hypothetical protein